MRNRFLFVMALAGLALGLAIVLSLTSNLPTGMIPAAYADDAPPPDDKPLDTPNADKPDAPADEPPDADKPTDDSADKDENSGTESDDTPDADKPDAPKKPRKRKAKKPDVPADAPEAAPVPTDEELKQALEAARAAGALSPNLEADLRRELLALYQEALATANTLNAEGQTAADAARANAKAEVETELAKIRAAVERLKALQTITVTTAPGADRTMAADRTDKTKSYGGRP